MYLLFKKTLRLVRRTYPEIDSLECVIYPKIRHKKCLLEIYSLLVTVSTASGAQMSSIP